MGKDAVITVRVSRAARRRIEEAARLEGRSLSQLVERLIERGLSSGAAGGSGSAGSVVSRPLAGRLAAGRVPTLADFRRVRSELSAALVRRASL